METLNGICLNPLIKDCTQSNVRLCKGIADNKSCFFFIRGRGEHAVQDCIIFNESYIVPFKLYVFSADLKSLPPGHQLGHVDAAGVPF